MQISQTKMEKRNVDLINISWSYSHVRSSFLSVVCSFFMSFNTLSDTSLALVGRTCTIPADPPRVFIVVVTSTSPFWWLYALAETERCLEGSDVFFFFFFWSNCYGEKDGKLCTLYSIVQLYKKFPQTLKSIIIPVYILKTICLKIHCSYQRIHC